MVGQAVALTLGLAGLAALFRAVEGRWAFRAATRTDVAWWFVSPVVRGALEKVAILAAVVSAALVARVPLDQESLRAFAEGGPSPLPVPLQFVVTLVLADLIGYASHRLFHRGWLWRFHAIHHSSKTLDWLSAVRVHPINEALNKAFLVASLLLVSRVIHVQPSVVAAVTPVLVLYAIFLHADVRWSYGPLRYVIASPVFHRWHHTHEGGHRNFAGLFPWIDLLFGTFFMPAGRLPAGFGVDEDDVPAGFWGQLWHPFRAGRTPPSPAPPRP